ncbi:hypothetical protein [Streptomyces sp. NPDC058964]|uniref:hypothetical protein n=1 Tax=Streptomyces sp. NPDC058964 TaxID=3346681 RepID=UPI00367C0251
MSLSIKALEEDPMARYVRLTEPAAGAERTEGVVQAGHTVTARITEVDLPNRRIALSHLQALPSTGR